MTPYESYIKYLALKKHFTSSYDFFKYNGKVKANPNSFENRRDRYMFEKLAKKPDPVLFLVSNLYKKPNSWLGEFINENGDKNYKEFIKRHESITFYFQEDLTKMLSSLDDNLIVNNGQHPYLLKLITREEVGLDTVLILNKILNFFPYWDKNIVENVIWPSKKFAIEKCDKFVHFSEAKCKKALEDHFN